MLGHAQLGRRERTASTPDLPEDGRAHRLPVRFELAVQGGGNALNVDCASWITKVGMALT